MTFKMLRSTPSDDIQPTPRHSNADYPENSYERGLLLLGEILIQKENPTPWMSLRKLSGQWRKHWNKLPSRDNSIYALMMWSARFFETAGEIRGDRVRVSYKQEWSGERRGSDSLFQFQRIYPDGSCC